MTTIKIKRIGDPADASDGYRIFIDRLYPRGISKSEFKVDLWAKEITPSDELRRWYHQDKVHNWREFRDRYTSELEKNIATPEFIDSLKQYDIVTLLTEVKEVDHSHAIVLKEYIERFL